MKSKFPATFWTANTVELFERGAYYAVASFVVIYLNETLGMAPTKSTFLNGTLLWGLIYFLPILSGTLADRFGFKKSLVLAFLLISLGYLTMGSLQRTWPALIGGDPSRIDYTLPAVAGILLIGIGGSIVKPCISGTVQKTSGSNTTFGFAIFYMVINIGSMLGRTVSYFVRTHYGIPAIFSSVATTFALIGLLIVLFIYREPLYQQPQAASAVQKPKSAGEALKEMVIVLGKLRFVFFLVVISFFWFIYVQIYNLIPLYLRFIDKEAPVELYTLMNPVMIVCFQLLLTRFSKAWSPLKSIMAGVGVTVVGMLLNIIPSLTSGGALQPIAIGSFAMPLAGLFILISIASMAVGEMFASPRIYQYIGAIAPRGQEGLYLGYANLPMALGTIVGAPLGGYLFESLIRNPADQGLATRAPLMWTVVALMGIVCMAGLWLYDRIMLKK
ncbi:MAG TPA: MFS transporter [bacterium]|nr:MFS transporter [bacterium]HQI49719.1 MFS transporter [bacterium]HQJ65851.1 MFS transporter [bacterium]